MVHGGGEVKRAATFMVAWHMDEQGAGNRKRRKCPAQPGPGEQGEGGSRGTIFFCEDNTHTLFATNNVDVSAEYV